jgi:hypothetical protein
MVFGTSQAINTSNYLFVKCLEEVQKISGKAVAIYCGKLYSEDGRKSCD